MVKIYKTKFLLMLMLLLGVSNVRASETEIYVGPTDTGEWSGYAQISADKFANAKVDDIIKVYTSNVQEGAQGSFKDGSTWGAIADGFEYFEISGDFTMTITDEILEKLKASGLIVGGQKYTIESVAIETADAGTTETEIYAGPTDTGSWSGYAQIAAGAFASAKVGDIIKVYTSNVQEGAQGSFKDGSTWGAIADGFEYFEISGDFTMTITDEILEKLKASGLIVGGQKYIIESVAIVTAKTATTETEIYAGPFEIVNWNALQLPATLFANCTTEQTIKVYISNVADGAQGSFKDGSTWGEIAAGTEYFNISGDNFTLAIDDDILAKLKASGLIVSGHDYTIESVVIISPASGKETNADLFPIANNDDVEVYDATFDAATKTIAFQNYGIAGWSWTPSYDMSMYESVTIELEEKTTTSITVQISYVNKASAEYVEIASGKKKIEFALNEDYANAVESVYLYPTNADATSIVLKTVYGTLKPGQVDGIEESIAFDTESSVLSRTYYNMAGQQSSQMHKGLNIIRMQMSDGTVKVKKIIVK